MRKPLMWPSLPSTAWWPSSLENQSSGDASTSPAVLWERGRARKRLAEDGSLHRALRQNTGPSRRQLGRSRPRDSSDECDGALAEALAREVMAVAEALSIKTEVRGWCKYAHESREGRHVSATNARKRTRRVAT